ncbi:MAG TPA: LPD7 domain-containing protein, partial [Polyangiaceae bacterium]|nr:LPD7 domain-containing protein [Polyangiaceae bacterium]
TVNNGFDHEVAHRAIARIELEQGWQREDRGLFVVRTDGELERARSRGDRPRQPTTRARDFEHRTGERSAQRIAAEVAAPIIRAARDWGALHQALGREGIRFERNGSGAILWVGDEPVKASTAGRDCSMAALSNRLGEFQAALAPPSQPLPRRAPERAESRSVSWNRYVEERIRDTAARAAARGRVVERRRDERQRMTDRQRAERTRVLRGSWRGRGDLLNATRSLLAATHAQEKADLRDRQKQERATELAQGRFPMFREWLKQRSPGEAEQRWHHHRRSSPSIEGSAFVTPEPQDIRAFMATMDHGKVHYHRASDRHAAFTDSGKVIDIHHATDRASVLAALQLSAQKWGTFTVHGNESFRRVCVELAREHGFKIANPELQRALGLERPLAPGRGLSL